MEFYDINKFPKEKWLIIFPISMSKISNQQSIEECIDQIITFEKKVLKTWIWIVFVYTDFLYMYNPWKASDLKKKFMQSSYAHKNGIMKFIYSNVKYIPEAFTFLTRNQLYLCYDKFYDEFQNLIKKYNSDKVLQSYVKQDIKIQWRKATKNQIYFTLEEYLMTYLLSKGKIKIYNQYIWDSYNWILIAYPWNTTKTLGYLYQKKLFNYDNPQNPFENSFYNTDKKIIYDNMKIDLEKYNYE